jgi:drug/metabolite transporter (DMT)-like permease
VGAVFALASALSYGLSDFLGGMLSRRAPFIRVALAGQAGGLIATLAAAPFITRGVPDVPDLLWGCLSGIGTGMAMTFLFRGMSRGAMSIVVPVSAVGGVALPVLAETVVLGERPAVVTWIGIGLALPALWLVSRGGGSSSRPPSGVVADALLAGVGIGVQYLALAQATPAAGIWPVAAGRVTALSVVGLASAVLRPHRTADDRELAAARRADIGAAGAGALAALGLACFLFATRSEFVAVAVVLSSLYPIVPVTLGLLVLHEKLSRASAFGLIAALGASALIAMTS